MKLLNSIHLYPPEHLCGAEFMAHWANKYMHGQGDEVRVLLHQARHYSIESMYVYDGIDVFPPEQLLIEKLFLWSDAVFTHLDYTDWTISMGQLFKRPIFHLIHNTHTYGKIVMADDPQFIVYNSEWARETLGYKHDSIVVHPPCDWRHYDVQMDTSRNEYITLINLDQNKGGHILRKIAEAMPERKFIGVMGSYSEPANIGQHVHQPNNVKVVPKTDDIRQYYRQTRILIMPSEYESWGRTATEAMCSGIPVISSGTPGLRENCGSAGIYVDRDDIAGWVKAIESLDHHKAYNKWRRLSFERSRELDPQAELAALRIFVRDSINKYKARA